RYSSRASVNSIKFGPSNSAYPPRAHRRVTVTYTVGQSAGDLNVVIVGWNDSTTAVASVSDTTGNSYTLAVGPTVRPGPVGGGGMSQAIYYAKNIAGAAANENVVTVRFSAAASYPDVRILEYG